MKRLSCWVGRHTWQTTVEEGYTMTSCSACGTMRTHSWRRRGVDRYVEIGVHRAARIGVAGHGGRCFVVDDEGAGEEICRLI